MRALRERGMAISDDMAVVGSGEPAQQAKFQPNLIVRASSQKMG